MTVRWIEGFEVDQHVDYLLGKYQNRPSTAGFFPGRLFGKSLQARILITPALISSPGPEWVIGMGWKNGSNPGVGDLDRIDYFNGGLRQLTLRQQTDRTLQVLRGATVLATSTTKLHVGDWQYIEFKALIHPSTGSYEVRIDGVVIMSSTAANTAEAGINDADVVRFNAISNARFDDIYILDTAGGIKTDFLGPRVVEGLLPNADGDTLEWTPSSGMDHFALVDDPVTSLSVADYVSSQTVGNDDLFSFEELEFVNGDIDAITINTVSGLEGVATRTYRVKYRSVLDAEGNGPTVTVDNTTARNLMAIMEEDPSGTPDRWAIGDINTGQFGVEVVS